MGNLKVICQRPHHRCGFCPVITAFVIRINDAIDKPARQDLKDYATRIMGTNDEGRNHRARSRGQVGVLFPREQGRERHDT